jgi:hypothetical protein
MARRKTTKRRVKKKQTRRSKVKHAALKPEYNLKTRFEEISDMHSYMHKLTDKQKDWLNRFAEEYVNASFPNPEKDPEKFKKRLHKSKKRMKSCYDKNNSRQRDVLTKAIACGKVMSFDKVIKDIEKDEVQELDIEELIDNDD